MKRSSQFEPTKIDIPLRQSSEDVVSMFESSDGRIWFNTRGFGVYAYNGLASEHFDNEHAASPKYISVRLKSNRMMSSEELLLNWAYRFGEDGQWRPITGADIDFYGLSPGGYHFELKKKNETDISETFTLTVTPFWYNTIMFRLFLLILSLSLVAAIVRSRAEVKHQKHLTIIALKQAESFGNYAGYVAHELKSSLANVISLCEIHALEMLKSGKALSRSDASILFSVKHMNSIIDVLLLDALLAAGKKIKLVLKSFNTSKLISDLKNLCQHLGIDNNIKIEYQVSKRTPEYFISDNLGIFQILLNLIKNAVEHSLPNSKVLIELDFKNDFLIYTITDEGEGIAKEMIKEIVKENVSLKDHAGHGIGLHLTNIYATVLGSGLTIQSSGKGSIFSFDVKMQTSSH